MRLTMTRNVALLLASWALFAPASAAAASAWKNFDEPADSVLATAACRALTSQAKSTLPIELSLVVPKEPSLLPIVYMKVTGLVNKAPWAMIRFAKKEFQPAFLIKPAAAPSDPDVYWYAPKDLSRLIAMASG